MLRNNLLHFTFGLLLTIVLTGASFGQEPVLDGVQIVQKMAQQYAYAGSYSDVGVVRGTETDISFKTYFERPNKIRFEWETGPRFKGWQIVWSDGTDIFTYWDKGYFEKEESLSLALAGATGVSRRAAHTVPVLLSEEVGGFKLTDMSNITLLREEPFEGEDCFVVRGFHPFGLPIELWIAKSDFLLRKSRDQNRDKTFREEIRRSVKINETLPENIFNYTPPKSKKNRR